MNRSLFFKASILTAIIFSTSTSFAQKYHGYTVQMEYDRFTSTDLEHDYPANDPSPFPHLKLKHVLLQQKFAVDAELHSFKATSLDEVKAMKEITFVKPGEHDPTFKNLVKNHPEIFNLFNIHHDRYFPKVENGPTLVNSNYEYQGISDRKFGYCWGFTTLVRYFHTLAFYDPSMRAPYDRLFQHKEWVAFYEGKINSVLRGEATVIPGMNNLRELSSVPELELHLKLHAMDLWEQRAIHLKTLGVFYTSTHLMKPEAVKDLIRRLDRKLARGEMPKLLFTAAFSKKFLGGSTDIHSVLVNKIVRMPDGKIRVMLWDANFYAETLIKHPKFLEIMPNGDIHFAPWWEAHSKIVGPNASTVLGTVQIAPEDERENANMLFSLQKFCAQNGYYCDGKH